MDIPVQVSCGHCEGRGARPSCKHCGKNLSALNVAEALLSFADNMPCGHGWQYLGNSPCPFCGATGKIERLAELEDVAEALGITHVDLERALKASATKEKPVGN